MDFKIYQVAAKKEDPNSILKDGDTVEVCILNLYDLIQMVSDTLELKQVIKTLPDNLTSTEISVILQEHPVFKNYEKFMLEILAELKESIDFLEPNKNDLEA